MDIEKAIQRLEDMPEFEFLVNLLKEYKETHVNDLSNINNAENPQLLAYLAGGISVLNIFLNEIDEHRTPRSDPA